MAKLPGGAVRKLPWWAALAGSTLLAFHLFAILMLSLAAMSGPWPVFMGADFAEGPMFAGTLNNMIYPYYLRPLGLTHNYHFLSNRTAQDGIRFEIILLSETGNEIKTLSFPEKNANFYVKHRQHLLAQALGNDTPVPPRGPEKVAMKGGKVPLVDYWLNEKITRDLVFPKDKDGKPLPPSVDPGKLNFFPKTFSDKFDYLTRISLPETQELPPGAAMSRPSPWALILAKSYMRFLCEKYQAHSAVLIRHSRPAVLPPYAIMDNPPSQAFSEMIAYYGDLKLDFEEVQK